MAGQAERGKFEERRRKEQVAFLVVKFLRLYIAFKEVAAEFHARSSDGSLASAGLFHKVADLSQSMGFPLKELAHALFRTHNGREPPLKPARASARLAAMKTTLERRFLDSSIGTGYHLLTILMEALYQVERYSPELDREKAEIGRVMELSRGKAPKLDAEQQADLDVLRALDEFNAKLREDSSELAHVVIRRCEDLLDATARVIRRFGTSADDNEILVLNLLRHRDLVEQVYGDGAAESILSELCAGTGFKGRSGVERALALVHARCGNLSGLAPAGVS